MTAGTWRYLIAAVLLAHGLGHLPGLFPLSAPAWVGGWPERSWLLTPLLGGPLTLWLGALLWLASIGGFTGAALGLLADQAWWRRWALVSAVVSMSGIALFWSVSAGLIDRIEVLMIDACVLVALLESYSPTARMAGAPPRMHAPGSTPAGGRSRS